MGVGLFSKLQKCALFMWIDTCYSISFYLAVKKDWILIELESYGAVALYYAPFPFEMFCQSDYL